MWNAYIFLKSLKNYEKIKLYENDHFFFSRLFQVMYSAYTPWTWTKPFFLVLKLSIYWNMLLINSFLLLYTTHTLFFVSIFQFCLVSGHINWEVKTAFSWYVFNFLVLPLFYNFIDSTYLLFTSNISLVKHVSWLNYKYWPFSLTNFLCCVLLVNTSY